MGRSIVVLGGTLLIFTGPISLVAVLMFHAIGRPGLYTISPRTLAAELSSLRARHVRVLSLSEFERYIDGKLQIRTPSVLLTFDDANKSNYTLATPILRKFKDPAVEFTIGDRIGPDPRSLSPADVRAMAATGLWSFGSHTYNLHSGYGGNWNLHYYAMHGLDARKVLAHDMAEQNAVFAKLGLPQPNAFAFPFGFYTQSDLRQLHLQFPYLFTSNSGFALPGEYLIPRINVGSDFASLGRLDYVLALMQHPTTVGQAVYESRAQFIVQLDQSLGIQMLRPPVQTFSDVPASNPDFAYIEAAYAAGFVQGVTPRAFQPNAPITRAQAAKILVEAYLGGHSPPSASTSSFVDNATIPRALVSFVADAVRLGLMHGLLGNRFMPQAYLTVAQERHLVQNLSRVTMGSSVPSATMAPLGP